MPISQCPQCVLKFSTRSEMKWHLREDHPSKKPAESAPMTVPVRRAAPASEASPHRRRGWRHWWRRQ